MKEIEDDFGNWFAGFSDGEAYFQIANQYRNNPRASYQCKFNISLRDDDKEILVTIRNTLGIGFINDVPSYPNDSCSRKPQSGFHVSATNECAKLVDLFEKYPLRAKKKRDFTIWKQAVAELQKPIDNRDPDLLDYWFRKIQEVRQYEKQDELIKPTIKKLQLIIEF